MKSRFSRTTRDHVARRNHRRRRESAGMVAEALERRQLLAIVTGGNGYLVVASNDASDIYMQRRADGQLWIADNSSFIDSPTVTGDFVSAGTPERVYVTNGEGMFSRGPLDRSNEVTSTQTVYSLAKGNINSPNLVYDDFGVPVMDPATGKQQVANPIVGTLSLGGTSWGFSIDPSTGGVIFQAPTGATPTISPIQGSLDSGSTPTTSISGRGGRGSLTIFWSDSVPTVGVGAPVMSGMLYSYNDQGPAGTAGNIRRFTEAAVLPSATSNPTFLFEAGPVGSEPVTGTSLGVIPGTASGTLVFLEDVPSGRTSVSKGLGSLSFIDDVTKGLIFTSTGTNEADIDWVRVKINGLGSFSFTNAFPTATGGVGTIPVEPGRVQFNVSFMRYVQNVAPNSFTLFAGFDLPSQLRVDLLTPGSDVSIDSPVVQTDATLAGGVEIRATTVNVNAPVTSTSSFIVGPSVVGAGTLAETLRINAPVAAPQLASIDIANDALNDATGGPGRGLLLVSTSGSISAMPAVTGAAVTSPTTVVLVDARTADVFLEGTIYGVSQSYLMQSTAADSDKAPFVFTTRSPRSEATTGLVRGGTVSITLANDADTAANGSIAFNTVDLDTQVDSLRVRSSARQDGTSVSASGPFPYNLSIREKDAVGIDAVAASSLPIRLAAGGSIALNSALQTAGDVVITAASAAGAPANFTVAAPITTTLGVILIEASDITVNNSLGVLGDAVDPSLTVDPTRNDVRLVATGGSIRLDGLVSAVNNIALVQRNPAGAAGRITGNARMKARALTFVAEGGVGDQTVPQTSPLFYLKTETDSISGDVRNGFAIDEKDDVAISQLRVGSGLVAIRADGVDGRAGSPNAIALTANLIDVTNLFVAAPNGSIDVRTDTAKTLVLGTAAAIQQGTVESMRAAGDVSIRSTGGGIDVLDAPFAGSGARAVRLVTTAAIAGAIYVPGTPGQLPSTISGSGEIGPALAPSLGPSAQTLRVNDRILVMNGVAGGSGAENGVYSVSNPGMAGGTWKLTRANDSDTTAEMNDNTIVRVLGGGRYFASAFDPAIPAPVLGTTSVAFTEFFPTTNIGPELVVPENVVTFVVSSAAGTNLGAGSLGKMITLRQENSPTDPGQAQAFKFSTLVNRPIVLSQELPSINTPFTIDGGATGRYRPAGTSGNASAIVVNGQFVGQTIDGLPLFRGTTSATVQSTSKNVLTLAKSFANSADLRVGMSVSGAGMRPGTLVTAIDTSVPGATRVTISDVATGTFKPGKPLTISVTFTTAINGFTFNEAATGAGIAGLFVGGFETGAAVRAVAAGVAVSGVSIGQDGSGNRLGNQDGLLVAGSGAATVTGGTITSNTVAGIRTTGNARVTVSGAIVGTAALPNVTGIEIGGSGGSVIGSAGGQRTTVQFNRTGISLRNGVNSVINTTASNNTFDGVSVEGGTNVIGGASLDNTSNAMHSNGRWGVNMLLSTAAARLQSIRKNYLGSTMGTAVAKNGGGNVALNGASAASLGYQPNASSGLDSFGNQHGVAVVTNPTPGPTKPKPPARPRPKLA